ncbi:SulA-like leucine-rich domain-containing protein [Vibrio sp. 10N.286.49.B3]|uniref:SulA-like leucine-rich domain-containing protein n=1 Tax=Vibrio sp. 10N.286.49.B3 TaxID=1880855 RepID=UPI000C844319|nr:SulA-like leucine-rich domain-containing protein [Vibrio sp. 10N.286.49.B3]
MFKVESHNDTPLEQHHFYDHHSYFTGLKVIQNDKKKVDYLNNLAQLSLTKKWILFTAECDRPSKQNLKKHAIQYDYIIHMKRSLQLSEADVVEKAIRTGTASAIVASDRVSYLSQRHLHRLAIIHHCEVFFIPAKVYSVH